MTDSCQATKPNPFTLTKRQRKYYYPVTSKNPTGTLLYLMKQGDINSALRDQETEKEIPFTNPVCMKGMITISQNFT